MTPEKLICQLRKNAQETVFSQLKEFKGRKFIDILTFIHTDGQNPLPTKKGLTVAPHLWPQFRRALAQAEAALIAAG